MILDLLRDMTLEMRGIDSHKAEIERQKQKIEKKELEKKEKIILPKWVKNFIFIVSILYLISCVGTFPLMIKSGVLFLIVRSVIQIVIAVSIMVLMKIKSKKAEVLGIGLVVIFLILQNSSIFMLYNL